MQNAFIFGLVVILVVAFREKAIQWLIEGFGEGVAGVLSGVLLKNKKGPPGHRGPSKIKLVLKLFVFEIKESFNDRKRREKKRRPHRSRKKKSSV
jgi:hypothetical protein